MEIPDRLTSLLRSLYAGKEVTEEVYMEKHTGSKSGKEYVKSVYCHLAYLTYTQNITCEMLDWMKHKQEVSLPGEIPVNSDMQMIPL